MKKKASQSLIDRICTETKKKRRTWFDRLSPEDQKLCLEVRERVARDALSPNRIAVNLIAELKLDCSRTVVRHWLDQGRAQ